MEQKNGEMLNNMPLFKRILDQLEMDLQDRYEIWEEQGFSPEMAIDCQKKYEELTGEKLSWDDVDSAILRFDEGDGIFRTRLNYFFLGYKMGHDSLKNHEN